MVIICIKTMRSKNRAISDIGLSGRVEGATETDRACGIAMNTLKDVGVQYIRKKPFNPSTVELCKSLQKHRENRTGHIILCKLSQACVLMEVALV